MNTKYPFTPYTPISRNPNIPLTPIPYGPSCLTNPSRFPSSSTPPSNTTVSSNPNLQSSSSNVTQNPVNSLPPPQPTNFKIQHPKSDHEKAQSSARNLTPRKKLNRGRISTLAKTPPPCSESCGKQFFSAKAIHGHMRRHPERNWQGMKGPAKESVTEPSNLFPSQNTKEEIDAAMNLILISKGKYEDWMGEVRKRGKLSGFKEQRNEKEAIVNGGSSVEKKDFVGLDLDFNLPPSVEKEDEEGSTNNFNPNSNLGLRHLLFI